MDDTLNVIENIKVKKVIFNCGEYNDLEKDLIKALEKKNIKYYSCIKELNIDKYKLQFLNTKIYENENDNSSVIYTELNNYKFLFMGDAGVEVEEDLIEKYNLENIDVLKVGHHGSKTSSSKEFIDEINPKYSIISVGKNNWFGHLNDSVLDNLEESKIYRTDQDGSIMFKINKDKLKIETCPPYKGADVNYYNEIKEKLIKIEIYDSAKDYSKDRNKVNVYFETGKLLSEAGGKYRIIAREYELV